MGWLDRVLRRGFGDEPFTPKDTGMGFRVGIMREAHERETRQHEAAEIARRVNSTWLWTGDRWQRWSTVWKTYEDLDQTDVPTPLLDLLGENGITPAAGDRFRFVDDEWRALDPGAPDELPDGDDEGDDVEQPWG